MKISKRKRHSSVYIFCNCGECLNDIDKIAVLENGVAEYEPYLKNGYVMYKMVGFDGYLRKYVCKNCLNEVHVDELYIKRLLEEK